VTVYRIPPVIRAILFDIDGTLYTNAAYVRFQQDVLIEELARVRGESVQAVTSALDAARAQNPGKTGSLGNAMAALGIDITTSVEWRSRLIDPGMFLKPDPLLRQTLHELIDRKARRPTTDHGSLHDGESPLVLMAVTNNPRRTGEATLDALGVLDLFQRVVGLDDTMKSKPAREPYLLAASLAGAENAMCISIGDRYEVDLAIPLELGMGAVLVSGVEDVYRLPAMLFPGLT
jgi:phosphoglycolate phosphatase/putative hydrolase of the HAD superfamily